MSQKIDHDPIIEQMEPLEPTEQIKHMKQMEHMHMEPYFDEEPTHRTEQANQMQRLEKELEELHELFIELGQHVEIQGDQLDSIELASVATVENTAQAVKELTTAQKIKAKIDRTKVAIMSTNIPVAVFFGIPGLVVSGIVTTYIVTR